MENVLDLYHQVLAMSAAYPLVCVDETSKQHLQEVRQPLGIVEGSPRRYDAEYKRNGVMQSIYDFRTPFGVSAC